MIIVAVLAVFAATSSVIASSRYELGALALLASAVSVLDGFPGIVHAVVFHVFTPSPLLFTASSLVGCLWTHQNPLLWKTTNGLSTLSSTLTNHVLLGLGSDRKWVSINTQKRRESHSIFCDLSGACAARQTPTFSVKR
jgi:hypothetical protein